MTFLAIHLHAILFCLRLVGDDQSESDAEEPERSRVLIHEILACLVNLHQQTDGWTNQQTNSSWSLTK